MKWLASFFEYAHLSKATLRARLWLCILLKARPEKRAAIAHELAVRAWAEACEDRLHTMTRWMRGGLS